MFLDESGGESGDLLRIIDGPCTKSRLKASSTSLCLSRGSLQSPRSLFHKQAGPPNRLSAEERLSGRPSFSSGGSCELRRTGEGERSTYRWIGSEVRPQVDSQG